MDKNRPIIEIDSKSGFCFGVARAIKMAEQIISEQKPVVSLGDIVHNAEEISRLEKFGMSSTSHEHIQNLENKTVLFRAHGEPPSSYETLQKQGACIVDATCPVVLKLQQRIRQAWLEMTEKNGQIIVYGKKEHPEVTGLVGQTNGEAIVISHSDDIRSIDPSRPLVLFSQTTMDLKGFEAIRDSIRIWMSPGVEASFHNTICAQVGNRAPHLRIFASKYDVIVFVGGEKSSNAKVLFNVCKEVNTSSYFASSALQVQAKWFPLNVKSIGICGATSTPLWLMEEVATNIKRFFSP